MIWFTSDLHLNHENIIGYCNRPFRDVYHMNESLIENWNMCVDPDDTVWVLGDLLLGERERGLKELIPRLNGLIYLVPGNHDPCWSGSRGPSKRLYAWRGSYRDAGIILVEEQKLIEIDIDTGIPILLCHFPYAEGDVPRHGDKYNRWRPDDEGYPLLHGHRHGKKNLNGHMIDVGVDANRYMPISMDEVCNLVEQM